MPDNVVCRLCLSKRNVKHSIFQESSILHKINVCLPVKILECDDLPKLICGTCFKKIDGFYDYIGKTVNAEKQLAHIHRSAIDNEGIKNEPTDSTDLKILHMKNVSKSECLIPQHSTLFKSYLTSKCTQTDLTLLNTPLTTEITNNGIHYVDIKVKNEPPDIEGHFIVETDVNSNTKYSSDEELTLSSLITSSFQIKNDDVINNGRRYKRNRIGAKSKKKNVKQTRGKLKKSANEIPDNESDLEGVDDKQCSDDNVCEDGVDNVEDDVKVKRRRADPEDSDYIFYPKGTPEEEKKWQCLTCFVFRNSRLDLLDHYKQHAKELLLQIAAGNENKNLRDKNDDDFEKVDNVSDVQTVLTKSDTVFRKTTKRNDFAIVNSECGIKEYECNKCHKKFKGKKSVKKHLSSHDTLRLYVCNKCNRSFRKGYELLLHGRSHNKVKTLFCKYDMCDYSTYYAGALASHYQTHEADYKYTCEICKKGFNVLTWFNEHKNLHTGNKPFECEICGKGFIYNRYLYKHRRVVHSEMMGLPSANKFPCEQCPKRFQDQGRLDRHMTRDHGAESKGGIICDICGKELSSKPLLKFHRRTHTGERPFSCRWCSKSFIKKCNLKLHERRHTGDKSYVCQECGKAFAQKSTLIIHERCHSGVRPYKCKNCNKGYVASGLLSMHMKTCLS